MLSGDIELNPGPHLENLIEYSKNLKNRGTSHSPLFLLIYCQSLKNKFEEFANFSQTAPINTFVAVTETWLDTYGNIENNFLTATHTFFGKCRAEETGDSKGGGLGIFVPKKFTADIKPSRETVDESFFESIWVEIIDHLTEKLLVKVSYCPNKHLGEYFLVQLSTEISGAYSVTDNFILLGDYNLNYLNKTEKSKLDIFASNSGLEIVNLGDATRCTDKTFTLIDQCFLSKDQIIADNVTSTHFNSDHFLVIFESNLSLKSVIDKLITMRNFRLFSRSKFNRDLAFA